MVKFTVSFDFGIQVSSFSGVYYDPVIMSPQKSALSTVGYGSYHLSRIANYVFGQNKSVKKLYGQATHIQNIQGTCWLLFDLIELNVRLEFQVHCTQFLSCNLPYAELF